MWLQPIGGNYIGLLFNASPDMVRVMLKLVFRKEINVALVNANPVSQ